MPDVPEDTRMSPVYRRMSTAARHLEAKTQPQTEAQEEKADG